MKIFPNTQVFDFEGLSGRVRSASYTPEPEDPKFEPMMRLLKAIFDKHQKTAMSISTMRQRSSMVISQRLPDAKGPRNVWEHAVTSDKKFFWKRWESLSKRHEARVDDVSMSGCFVNTYGPVEVGEPPA